MRSQRFVRVGGPASLGELVAPVREALGLAEGEYADGGWRATVVSVRHAELDGYDYVVVFDAEGLDDEVARRLFDADSQARQLFYHLASTTGWALCLLDHVGDPRVQRPTVVPAAPVVARPLDAGPQPLRSERTVRVTGPASLAELVAPVRDALGLPDGEYHDGSWHTTVVSVSEERLDGYDYVVRFDPEGLEDEVARRLFDADREARQLFYHLASTTGWALCLLDHVGDPRVQRPAVAEV